MTYLVDTGLLLWASSGSPRLSAKAKEALASGADLFFSVASLWEIAIKQAKQLPEFGYDAAVLRRGFLQAGYREIDVTAEHALEVRHLPPVHGDPFDRILVAQARVEGLVLLTADRVLAAYGPPVRLV